MLHIEHNCHMKEDNECNVYFAGWDASTDFENVDATSDQMGNNSWNLNLFDQRVGDSTDWKDSTTIASDSHSINRLQDLCLGFDGIDNENAHVEPTNKELPWPFESSPCIMFGGKNTKLNSANADATHKELFDPKFVDKKHVNITDYMETEEFQTVEATSTQLSVDSTTTPARNLHRAMSGFSKRRTLDANRSFSEKRTDCRSGGNRNLRAHDSMQRLAATAAEKVKSDDDQYPQRHSRSRSRSESRAGLGRSECMEVVDDEKRRNSRHTSRSRSISRERLGPSRSRSKSRGRLGPAETERGRVHTASMKVQDDVAKGRSIRHSSRSRSKSREREESTAFRVLRRSRSTSASRSENSTTRSSSRTRSKSQARRAAPERRNTSDNLGLAIRGASKTRNSGGVSQREIVSKGNPQTEQSATSIRRPNIKRAMSIENVRPPEQYGPSTATSLYGGGELKRRGRRMTVAPQTAGRSLSRGRNETDERVKEELLREKPNTSPDESSSSDDDSSVEEGAVQIMGKCTKWTSLNRDRLHRSQDACGQSSAVQNHDGDEQCAEPVRRDLRDLLRNKELVTREDLEGKENRRFLHFLMYEHKIGVSIEALKTTIRKELAEYPDEAFHRPSLPLYVEPA